ncbi:MAG TPA: hypothetical protein PLG09_07370 [Syntrophomonadaceae bacterium]|jgi:hypothetical protein|nr:hypothetical protein [Syntrophomonadaceae bacterium]HOQ09930.1 hypothetical protein [Syntrophomonadaceae bacterium]HPU48982.1 hypothetical protein [Syntrophomonadaceae bacterium]
MVYILLLFTLLYILLEGRELLQNKSWKEALLAAVIIAVSMVYGLDYLRNGMNLPHPGHLFERLMPLVDAYNAFFKLPT